jgi:NADP-dependent 3-hydroxy acid dehydrogenase YdfG
MEKVKKIAFISGAAKGIGESTASLLARIDMTR